MWEEPGQPCHIHAYTVYTSIGGKGRCRTRGESEESVVHRWGSMQVRESTLALKPRADVARSPKRGYQWPHKKDLCPAKFFLKNKQFYWVLSEKESGMCFESWISFDECYSIATLRDLWLVVEVMFQFQQLKWYWWSNTKAIYSNVLDIQCNVDN